MHDLVHDLAGDILKSKLFYPKSVRGEKLSQVRYFGWDSPRDQIEKINEPERVCTLFWRSNYVSEAMLLSFKFLRVLNLSCSGIKVLFRKCCQIEEFGRLKNLRCELTIKRLQLVVNKEEARTTYLQKKPNIYKLAYLWSHDESEGCEINDEHVLDGLQPHPNFTKFPSWFTKGLLPNLVMLKLSGCKSCKHIPSLGQMKFLRHLELLGVLSKEYRPIVEDGISAPAKGEALTNAQKTEFEGRKLKDLKAKNYLF
ncbi:putative disease resistance protein RGA3 [Solanum stenotomum]|uniref:putative disease resistance protein RGA3 n=1 Tax=Solanum stenotomum TaxID=172797 RepID=UPI0020D0C591|nr:putative disease resistance protein RGA3 [Solanum stenotomum]